MTPIALATDNAGPAIPVGVPAGPASAIAITPDGKTAYVASDSGTVTPIDMAPTRSGTPIPVGELRTRSRSPRTARPPT